MWNCRKCGKPVFFAERKQSLGFDWHPNCLRCEECGKRLNPGQHAEHKGVPYCHHPCYGALFGPQLFGHGTRNECHTSFGKVENRDGKVKRSHLETRLKEYNQYYENKPGELKFREVNGRMILEGVLKIYWGVRNVIHLKEEDDQRTIAIRRRSAISSTEFYTDSDDEEPTVWREDPWRGWQTPQTPSTPQTPTTPNTQRFVAFDRNSSPVNTSVTGKSGTGGDGQIEDEHSTQRCQNDVNSEVFLSDLEKPIDSAKSPISGTTQPREENYAHNGHDEARLKGTNGNSATQDDGSEANDTTTTADGQTPSKKTPIKTGSTAIRRRPGRRMDKTKLKRRCSINGHFYLRETSSFTPPHGAACSVWVTSLVTVEEVLNMLLDKYKVEMSMRNFALFVIKDNGERRRMRDDEYPLITRVMLGPHEEVARVFIVDAHHTDEISPQVAQFLNLSLAECRAILLQYQQEELRQVVAVQEKFKEMEYYIQRRMKELRGV